MKLENLTDPFYISEDALMETEIFQKILTEDQEVQNIRGPLTADEFCLLICLAEGKNKNKDKNQEKAPVTFMYTKNAEKSIGVLTTGGATQVMDRLNDFVQFKSANPIQPFGGKDYPFKGEGPLSGYKHAHLGRDSIVVYKYDGKLNRFCIFGVFSHDDLGIGNPANPSKMRSIRKSFDQQSC